MTPAPSPNVQPKPLALLTKRDIALLLAINEHRVATAWDMAHWEPFSPASHNHVREIAASLAGGADYQPHQYLCRFPRPHTSRGTSEKIFALGACGRDFLTRILGQRVRWCYQPYKLKGLGYSFLAHALLLTRVVTALSYFCRTHPAYTLTDCRLGHALAQTTSVDTKTGQAPRLALPVLPDAWALLHRSDGQGTALWLEVDCGTEGQEKYKAYLEARIAFLRRDYETVFDTPAVLVCYLTTGPTEAFRVLRRTAMQRWTRELLAECSLQRWAGNFRFAAVEYRSLYDAPLFDAPLWYRPDSDTARPLFTGLSTTTPEKKEQGSHNTPD